MRTRHHLWAGLPILCTEGDTLAELVEGRDLGEVVPAEDPSAIARAVERLLDRSRRDVCAAHLAELAGELTWETVAAPVVEFCRHPRHAADREGGAIPRTPVESQLHHLYDEAHEEIHRLRREREGLLREIDVLSAFRERVQGSLPYRTFQRIRGG